MDDSGCELFSHDTSWRLTVVSKWHREGNTSLFILRPAIHEYPYTRLTVQSYRFFRLAASFIWTPQVVSKSKTTFPYEGSIHHPVDVIVRFVLVVLYSERPAPIWTFYLTFKTAKLRKCVTRPRPRVDLVLNHDHVLHLPLNFVYSLTNCLHKFLTWWEYLGQVTSCTHDPTLECLINAPCLLIFGNSNVPYLDPHLFVNFSFIICRISKYYLLN